jgi:hypothetical protein
MLRTTWRELETEVRDGLRPRQMAKAAGKQLLPGPKATAPALDPTCTGGGAPGNRRSYRERSFDDHLSWNICLR